MTRLEWMTAAATLAVLALLFYGMLSSLGCGGLCDCPFGSVCVEVRPGVRECRPEPGPRVEFEVAVDGGGVR